MFASFPFITSTIDYDGCVMFRFVWDNPWLLSFGDCLMEKRAHNLKFNRNKQQTKKGDSVMSGINIVLGRAR